MVTKSKIWAALGAVTLMLSVACSQDLNVADLNEPDQARVTASPADVQSLAISSVNAWYQASTYYDPWAALDVTADALTSNFGNFGMRFDNVEPRTPYNNISSNGDAEMAYQPWSRQYKALGQANDVLRAVAGGMTLPGGTAQYKALAQFVQAGSLMQLALLYDKAFVVDETMDVTKALPAFSAYPDVAKAAQAKLDAVIAATAGQNWSYASTVLPMPNAAVDAAHLNRIANTLAALLLTYTPRNAADAAKVDWAKVLQYADKGIGTGSAGAPFDFTIKTDATSWYSFIVFYENDPTWMRVDQHLIHQMDATVPDKFDGTVVRPSGAGDARLGDGVSGQDYKFENTVIGDATRGIYMQSPYSHTRYVYASQASPTSRTGNVPYILAAESDLAKAEALVRTNGDLTLASQLINNTRVNRGKLPAVSATSGTAALLSAITYERVVETMATNGFTFFQLRHDDALQNGTLRHMPVPAQELETLALPIYTFGGVGLPVQNVVPATGFKMNANGLLGSGGKRLELPNGQVMTLPDPESARGGWTPAPFRN
jgi:hypothetical protein